MHLLGYSLGAHAAGIAGSLTNKKVNRITGKKAVPFIFSQKGWDACHSERERECLSDTRMCVHSSRYAQTLDYSMGGFFFPGVRESTRPCSHGLAICRQKEHRACKSPFTSGLGKIEKRIHTRGHLEKAQSSGPGVTDGSARVERQKEPTSI